MNLQQLHYLSSILQGKREITEDEAVIRAERLQLFRLKSPFLVAEVAPYYDGVKATEKDDLIQDCADYVKSILSKDGFCAFYYLNEFDNVQVIFTSLLPVLEARLEKALINIRNKLQFRFELDSFIGIGSVVNTITAISSSAHEAAEMLAYKYTYAEQGVVNIKNLIRFSHSPNYSSDIHFDRVIGCFQDGNIGKMAIRLSELVENVRNKPNASKTAIKHTFIELTVSVLHVAANADVDTSAVVGELDIYQWILDQQHTEILTEWFIKLCDDLHTRIEKSLESTEKKIVQAACNYVEAHLDKQELSLNSVSDEVGLSSFYFSKLFKREKGIGLSNYISKVRIDCAKRMLENTDYPLTVIALQSGFSNARYFSQVFKKAAGVTPGEYRRTTRN